MNRIKLLFLTWCLAGGSIVMAGPCGSCTTIVDAYVYKLTVSLPVSRISNVNGVNKMETKTLATADFVNIALGRKLGTKVDAKTEVLAVSVPGDRATQNSVTPKLLIFNLDDPSATITLGTFSDFDVDYATRSTARGESGKGLGYATLTLNDTGTSVVAKFYATTLNGGGAATASVDAFVYDPHAVGAATSFAGKLHLDFTGAKDTAPTSFDGYIVNGKFSISGKEIAIRQE